MCFWEANQWMEAFSASQKKKKIKKEKLIHSDLCSCKDTVQKMKRQTMKKIFANLIFQKESTKMCIKSFSRSFAKETYGWKTGMGNDVQWCWSSGKYKLRLQWGPHVPADLAGPAAGQDVECLDTFQLLMEALNGQTPGKAVVQCFTAVNTHLPHDRTSAAWTFAQVK